MVSITLSIPKEVKKVMEHFSEIDWSGFVRNCIIQKTKELSWKDETLAKLKEDEEITKWAVKLQKTSRKGRFAALKEKGLI